MDAGCRSLERSLRRCTPDQPSTQPPLLLAFPYSSAAPYAIPLGGVVRSDRFTLATWPVVFSWDARAHNPICYLRGAPGDAGAAAASLRVAAYRPHAGRQHTLTPTPIETLHSDKKKSHCGFNAGLSIHLSEWPLIFVTNRTSLNQRVP